MRVDLHRAGPRHFTVEGIGHAAELGVPFAAVLVPVSDLMALVGGFSVASGAGSSGARACSNHHGDDDTTRN